MAEAMLSDHRLVFFVAIVAFVFLFFFSFLSSILTFCFDVL